MTRKSAPMGRQKERLLEHLREQMEFLLTSVEAFYRGSFAESLRIATAIRVLVHETSKSKSLLQQIRPDGLQLPILDAVSGPRHGEEEVFRFDIGIRLGPGPISPAIDLASTHYALTTIGAWWAKTVFRFQSRLMPVTYRRREVILTLANKEGGAHVHPEEDPDYQRLLRDLPLGFSVGGVRIETPDLARFLTAQSGAQMLESLKRNFFPDVTIALKWEHGDVPASAVYMDQLLGALGSAPARPIRRFQLTKRR